MNGILTMRLVAVVAAAIAGVILAFPILVPVALAQSTGSGAMTVQEIRECLCLQPTLQPLQDAWHARQRDYDEHQKQLDNINEQISVQRSRLDPNDLVGQQVLKDLLAQQQELREAIRSQYLPALNEARSAYNAAVTDYNGKCTRPRYSVDEAAARQNLTCPTP